jgi:hypothetical protein
MSELQRDIEAYEREQAQLEGTSMGKWVLFHDATRICIVDTFDEAAQKAVTEFGDGPYLIRRIGTSGLTLPASVMYRVS